MGTCLVLLVYHCVFYGVLRHFTVSSLLCRVVSTTFSNCGCKVLSQLYQAGLNAFIVDAIDGDAFTSQDGNNGKAN